MEEYDSISERTIYRSSSIKNMRTQNFYPMSEEDEEAELSEDEEDDDDVDFDSSKDEDEDI